MKFIKKLCTAIDTFTEATGRVFSFVTLVTVCVILCEVIMRKCFNHPQIWTSDMILFTFGSYAALVCAYGFLNRSYVRVDLVVNLLPRIAEHIIHLVTYFIFMWPFLFWTAYRAYPFFIKSYSIGERQYSVWQPPIWPVKLIFCIGMTLLCVQAISETLKEVLWIYEYYHNGKQEPPAIGSLSLLKPVHSGDAPKEVRYE